VFWLPDWLPVLPWPVVDGGLFWPGCVLVLELLPCPVVGWFCELAPLFGCADGC